VNGKDAVNKDQLDGLKTSVEGSLDKGLNFAGNTAGTVINKKLGDTVTIKGGLLEGKDASDENLRVDVENGNLVVKMSKNLTDLESVVVGNTTVNGDGLTIANGPSVTKDGIDAGNQKITNVVNGSLEAGSKDAVNGSQIHDLSNNIANSLGGGAKFENGIWTGPNFKDALGAKEDITNVYDGFDYLNKNINGVVNGTSGLVIIGSGSRSGSIIINESIAGAGDIGTIDFSKDNGDTRKVTGVTEGLISSDSKDAINGSQLDKLGNSIAGSLGGDAKFENGNWTAPTYNLTDKNGNPTTASDVGDALGNLDGRIDQNTKDIAQNTKDIGDIKDVIGGYGPNGEAPTFTVGGKNYDTVHDALGGVNNTVNDIKNGKDGLIQLTEDGKTIVVDNEIAKNADSFDISGPKSEDNPNGDRKLTGVAKGDVSENSSDAINGSQLHYTNTVVSNTGDSIGKLLGGGAKINADGSVYYDNNGDALTINGKGYKTVAEAIEGMDQNQIFKVSDDGKKVVFGEVGKEVTEISFANGNKNPIKVTGVADGLVEEGSKDAVNGGQLYEVKRDITYINDALSHYNTRINNVEKKVHENRKVASAGIAGAMAMSSIPYIEYSKYSFGMGVGHYDGESALSIGFQGKINDRARYRLQMSYDTQNKVGLGAGVAFEF
ncbi:YadA-like family protein, partial [Ignatzschineria ureiclastica]